MDFRSAGVIAMLLIGLAGPGCQAFGGAAARNREVSLTTKFCAAKATLHLESAVFG